MTIRLLSADFPLNYAEVVIWDGNVGYVCGMSLNLLMALESRGVKLWTHYQIIWSEQWIKQKRF